MAECELTGMQELLNRLENLERKGQSKENKAVKKASEVLQQEIIKNAPEDTGNLKENIDVSKIKIKNETKYVEVGTENEGFYAKFLEFGTTKMDADPFMSRSFETKKNEIQDTIKKEIRKGLGLWT